MLCTVSPLINGNAAWTMWPPPSFPMPITFAGVRCTQIPCLISKPSRAIGVTEASLFSPIPIGSTGSSFKFVVNFPNISGAYSFSIGPSFFTVVVITDTPDNSSTIECSNLVNPLNRRSSQVSTSRSITCDIVPRLLGEPIAADRSSITFSVVSGTFASLVWINPSDTSSLQFKLIAPGAAGEGIIAPRILSNGNVIFGVNTSITVVAGPLMGSMSLKCQSSARSATQQSYVPIMVRTPVACTIAITSTQAPPVLGSAFVPIIQSFSSTARLMNATEAGAQAPDVVFITPDAGLGKQFTFSFLASSVSEVVSVSLANLMQVSVAVNAYPDNTSTFSCEYLGSVGKPVSCTLRPMLQSVPIVATDSSFIVMTQGTSLCGQAVCQSSDIPREATSFLYVFTASSSTGTVTISATLASTGATFASAEVVITQTPDATSLLQCRSLNMTAGATARCFVRPRRNSLPVSSMASSFQLQVDSAIVSAGSINDATISYGMFVDLLPQTPFSSPALVLMANPGNAFVSGAQQTAAISPIGFTVSSLLVSNLATKMTDVDLVYLMGRPASLLSEIQSDRQLSFSQTFVASMGSVVGASERFVSIECSNSHCLAVSLYGELWSWGRNPTSTQPLGRDTVGAPDFADRVLGLDFRSAVDVPNCAELAALLRAAASTKCEGAIQFVQVATTQAPSAFFTSTSVSYFGSAALTDLGEVYIWGMSSSHAPLLKQRLSFRARSGSAVSIQFMTSRSEMLLLAAHDNSVWAYGNPSSLSDGIAYFGSATLDPRTTIMVVPPQPSAITAMVSGIGYGIVAFADRSLWSWGNALSQSSLPSNDAPQMTAQDSIFPQLSAGEHIISLDGSERRVIALSSAGRVWIMTLSTPASTSTARFLLASDYFDDYISATAPFWSSSQINIKMISLGGSANAPIVMVDADSVVWLESAQVSSGNRPGPFKIQTLDARCGTSCAVQNGITQYKRNSIRTLFSSDILIIGLVPPIIAINAGISMNSSASSTTDLAAAFTKFNTPGSTFVLGAGVFKLPPNSAAIDLNSINIQGNGVMGPASPSRTPPAMIRTLRGLAFEGSSHAHVANHERQHRLLASTSLSSLQVPSTTIDCGGQTCIRFTGNAVRITGITFQNAFSSTQNGSAYVVPAGTSHTLINVAFVGNTGAFGGAIDNRGTLNMVNCTFFNNTALFDGGAISCLSAGASIQMSGTTIVNNEAAGAGGGLSINQCSVSVTGSTISSNTAGSVGGGACLIGATGSIDSSTLEANSARQNGGALFLQNSNMALKGSLISGSSANGFGAGLYTEFSVLSVTQTAFAGNAATPSTDARSTAVTYAGGLYCMGNRTLQIDRCSFTGNRADKGGAMAFRICEPVITATSFVQNSATKSGGAILFDVSSSASIRDGDFRANSAVLGGGAISMQNTALIAISRSTFFSNQALQITAPVGQGGAIEIIGSSSTIDLQNVTMQMNSALSGGAVFWDMLLPDLGNVTLVQNAAKQGPDFASTVRSFVFTRVPSSSFEATSGSGTSFVSSGIRIALLDFYNQTMTNDNSSSVAIESLSAGAAISGTINAIFSNGQSEFSAFTITSMPGLPMSLRFRAFVQGSGLIYTPAQSVFMRRCFAGEFQSVATSLCNPCPAGTFSGPNQLSCDACPPGTSSGVGAASCTPCPPGKVAPSAGSPACSTCAVNSITPFPGSKECTPCISNSRSDESRRSCYCLSSYYEYELPRPPPPGNVINFTCNACPTGADCRLDNQTRKTVVPLPGFYPDVSKRNDMFLRCLLPLSCIGGTDVCLPPSVGPLCSGCDAGYKVNSDWSCSVYAIFVMLYGVQYHALVLDM
jgi:predicted outer membrane repeat protein